MLNIGRKPVGSSLSRFEDKLQGVFCISKRKLRDWRRELDDIPPSRGDIAIAVIHNIRWIEWQVYSAFFLRKRGYRPVLLYSASEFQGIISAAGFTQRAIEAFHPERLDLPDIKLIELDTLRTRSFVPDAELSQQAERLSHMVTAYSLKVEEFEEAIVGTYAQRRAQMKEMILAYTRAGEIALAQTVPETTLLCPNGRFGLSVPLRLAAERLGRRAVFVEGWGMRPGHMLLGINRPAMEWDISGWLNAIGPWDKSLERDFQDYMRFRAGQRVKRKGWFDSFHQTQRVEKGRGFTPRIELFLRRPGPKFLFGTNCVGDSSTLGKATIFRSQKALFEQLLPYVAARKDCNLIIRVHPDEAVWFTNQPMGPVARSIVGDAPNVLIVEPRERINTHDLMDACDVGLAWVSNFGLEMALKRKPVIVCAAAPYAGLGLCYAPKSSEAFFNLIARLVGRRELPPSYAASEDSGKAYLYVLFNRMSLRAFGKSYKLTELDLITQDSDRDRYFEIVTGQRSPFE